MAAESNLDCRSYPAGGDLSAGQFKFVKLNSSGQVVLCTAVTDRPIGVLQNKPSATGRAATVCVAGRTKISADEALAIGDVIGTSTDAQAQVVVTGTETTVYAVGQVIEGVANAGEIASAEINCVTPNRAA